MSRAHERARERRRKLRRQVEAAEAFAATIDDLRAFRVRDGAAPYTPNLDALRSADPDERRDAFLADHSIFLASPEWREARLLVLLRDGWRCTRCGNLAEQVHHLTYARWQREALADLTSLCKACHDEQHEPEAIR